MKLTVLGNNGPFPAPGGACSGYLLRAGQHSIQLDFGTGTLSALTGLMPPEALDAVILSHWHFDHTSDLLPLLYRLEGLVAAGHTPLPIYAPVDESSALRRIIKASAAFALTDVIPGESFTIGSLQISTAAARHPVPAMMLSVTEGSTVLCYTGDTNTTDALPSFIADADLLLADGLFTDALWAESKPHLSASLCARLARDARVKRLVITHLNPNIDPATLLSEARTCYPAVELSVIGRTWTV